MFSLRTRDSVGVGEFLDINRLVDVCRMAGAARRRRLPRSRPHFGAITTELPAQCDGMVSNVQFNSHAGMRLIQLLPVNDTSVNMMWWDSYPYSSLSVGLPCSALLVLPHLSP